MGPSPASMVRGVGRLRGAGAGLLL